MKIDIENTEILGSVNLRDYKRLSHIIRTPKGKIPLRRNFGLDYTFVDQPIELMKAKFVSELNEQVKKHLPGKTIDEVTFSYLDSETILPRVVIIDE